MNPHNFTILLADDNPENLNVLSRILENKGYKVRTAKNGELALKSILLAPPDMALIDIHMPVMDGYALCKEIKNNSKISHIPVLFISAMDDSFNKVIAFDLGAVDYLSKPVDEKEVIARVNTHLEINQLQKKLRNQNLILEKEVTTRTQELKEALTELETVNGQLQKLNSAKNEFLQLISHELRTPLVGLGIMDELILGKELSEEEAKSYQNIFWASHQKLINIVDHATTLTHLKLSHPKYNSNNCNLHQLIESSFESLEPLMHTHEVSIEIQKDEITEIICDRGYIKIVLNALLETAIKFSHQRKPVKVEWEKKENTLFIEIHATGWTLPEKHMEKFFEIFAILEPIFPGGDLGLSPPVAKQILGVCGGEVNVRNRGEEGITLTVTLLNKD